MADFKNTKEGQNVAQKYADILHLSRPEPPVKPPPDGTLKPGKDIQPLCCAAWLR